LVRKGSGGEKKKKNPFESEKNMERKFERVPSPRGEGKTREK